MIIAFDDMIAECCLKRFGNLTVGKCESHTVEFGDHSPAAEPSEITAPLGRTGIIGFEFCDLGKITS